MWAKVVLATVVIGGGAILLQGFEGGRIDQGKDLNLISQATLLKVADGTRRLGDVPLPAPLIRAGSTADRWEAYGAATRKRHLRANIAKEVETTVSYRLSGRLFCAPGLHPDCAEYKNVDILVDKVERAAP